MNYKKGLILLLLNVIITPTIQAVSIRNKSGVPLQNVVFANQIQNVHDPINLENDQTVVLDSKTFRDKQRPITTLFMKEIGESLQSRLFLSGPKRHYYASELTDDLIFEITPEMTINVINSKIETSSTIPSTDKKQENHTFTMQNKTSSPLKPVFLNGNQMVAPRSAYFSTPEIAPGKTVDIDIDSLYEQDVRPATQLTAILVKDLKETGGMKPTTLSKPVLNFAELGQKKAKLSITKLTPEQKAKPEDPNYKVDVEFSEEKK